MARVLNSEGFIMLSNFAHQRIRFEIELQEQSSPATDVSHEERKDLQTADGVNNELAEGARAQPS